ncbi:MAG: beta-lactamase family protein [Bryobacterales bacterium]|nr:beta-lactamase family protein [Bryobacterales bacterium]
MQQSGDDRVGSTRPQVSTESIASLGGLGTFALFSRIVFMHTSLLVLLNRRRPRVASCLAGVLFFSGLIFAQGVANPEVAEPVDRLVDAYVKGEMSKRKIPGLAFAVLRHGKVIRQDALGLASIESNVPVRLDTSFPLASVTKEFTASAILSLVEKGQLSLDQPIRSILREVPETWSSVTVRHCLTHTSGLPDATTDDVNFSLLSDSRDGLLEKVFRLPSNPPGQKAAYNQTAYLLLDMILQRVTGRSVETYVRQEFFDRIGMTGATYGDAWEIVKGRSELYTVVNPAPDRTKLWLRDGRPVTSPDRIYRYGMKIIPSWMFSTSGSNASVVDLVKWDAAFWAGKVLKRATVDEMATPFKLDSGKAGAWGLGLLATDMGEYRTVASGGGAAVWLFRVPTERLTVIVLTNLQGSSPQTLAAGIAALYLPRLKTSPAGNPK